MEIRFDPVKDRINLQKHRISLAEATAMDFASVIVLEDEREDYGETRWRAAGMIDGRLHILVFTLRGEVLRAISLRKANARERKRYEGSRR